MKKIGKVDFLFELLRVLLGLLLAYLITLVCIAFVAEEPLEAIKSFSVGVFQTKTRMGILTNKLIPYILAGCGMCVVYSSGRFSLIGEGIINFAPIIACLYVFRCTGLVEALPGFLNMAVVILICCAVGGMVSAVPAYGREKLGANELVISVIMNTMLLNLSQFVLKKFMLDRSITYVATYPYPDGVGFSKLLGGTMHTGILISLAAYVLVCLIYYKSRIGAQIRACGSNILFAGYAGVNTTRAMYAAHILGGVCAGLAGCVDVFGLYSRYQYTALTSIGMDGLVVAVLARKQPIFVPLGALVLAYIKAAATVLNTSTNIPIEFVSIMQAILIMFVAAQEFLRKSRNRMVYGMTRKDREREGAR